MFKFLSTQAAPLSVRPVAWLAARAAPLPLRNQSSALAPAALITPADHLRPRYQNENSPHKDGFKFVKRSLKLHQFRESADYLRLHSPRTSMYLDFYLRCPTFLALLEDRELRNEFSRYDIKQYATILLAALLGLRLRRLNAPRNRDKDQRDSLLADDLVYRNAATTLLQVLQDGSFDDRLLVGTVRSTILLLLDFGMLDELIQLWETGVANEKVCKVYLDPEILGIVLPIAHKAARFLYQDILKIHGLNSLPNPDFNISLTCAVGKIAVLEGDYERGLDAMEELFSVYTNLASSNNLFLQNSVLRHLRDLHLTFVGSCKDINVATHFFDKITSGKLPYEVQLRVTHVTQLLRNCVDAKQPFSVIEKFWRSTLAYYVSDTAVAGPMNLRYLILNNMFFKIFFEMHPKLEQESVQALKQTIATCAEIKEIDETFLNNIISNYTWMDKQVYDEIINNYDVYNVERTPVLFRVILKSAGSVAGFTPQDILHRWNLLLQFLDAQGYTYIPVADWLALRDATVHSEYEQERLAIYYEILKRYCNYMQNATACILFAAKFSYDANKFAQVGRISVEENPDFGCDLQVDVPEFLNLSQNVDYRELTHTFVMNKSPFDGSSY